MLFNMNWNKEVITTRLIKPIILTFQQTPTLQNLFLIWKKNYQVDFNHQNSLAKVLGFTGTKYTEGVGKCC